MFVNVFVSVYPKKPTLNSSIKDLTVSSGTKVTLTCKTDSQGTISYKFLKNGHEISGATNGPTYNVPTQATSQPDSYTCVAIVNGAQSNTSTEQKIHFIGKFNL